MDRFDAMRLFVRIVALGSFSRAGDELGIPRATVSHALKQLEARLGTQLLIRTTRSVRATADGQAFCQRAQRLLADLEETEAVFSRSAEQIRGTLRIDLPGTLGSQLVVPALAQFSQCYPQLELDIGASDRFVDLVQEGVDCAVRAGTLADSALISRRIAEMQQVTCVSTGYVRAHGLPATLEDLASHRAVVWRSPTSGRVQPLDFMVDGVLRMVDVAGTVTVNQGEIYVAACRAGMGIVQLPRYNVAKEMDSGAFVEVLPQFPPPPMPLSVLYPAQRQLSLRLRLFVDWLAEHLADLH